MIKPSGASHATRIVSRLQASGYELERMCWRTLEESDVEVLYPAIRERLAESRWWQNHVRYMASRPCALLILRCSHPDPHRALAELKGADADARQCRPGTLRHDFPGPSIFNSFHSADNSDETERMVAYFQLST